MQIRIPLAAVLLSCAAMAQDGPVEGAKLPRPFAPKPRAFMWPKPVAPQNATTRRNDNVSGRWHRVFRSAC